VRAADHTRIAVVVDNRGGRGHVNSSRQAANGHSGGGGHLSATDTAAEPLIKAADDQMWRLFLK